MTEQTALKIAKLDLTHAFQKMNELHQTIWKAAADSQYLKGELKRIAQYLPSDDPRLSLALED